MFLEFCGGGDLEKKIKDVGAIPPAEAYKYFCQIAGGLKTLYDKHVQHRDLKPENVLMQDNNIKLADFGFAKYKEDLDDKEKQTSVGTPYYMAP